ncbi:hypothetical protein [Spongiactinospora gelatinilytica]|nr:hypothetical protein [Spongiactinospora gelatinilytica]
MRRYRFGRLAALLALGYVMVTAVLGVIVLTGGDSALLLMAVTHVPIPREVVLSWWEILLLVLAAAVEGWALWYLLRGRAAGARPALDRPVSLPRWALYL